MNTLQKLQKYMGNRKILLPISLLTSMLSSIANLLPFIFIWLIIRELLTTHSGITQSKVYDYAFWAVLSALVGLILYYIALMASHLSAFRVETNMRRVAMKKIVQMPLGFFDSNTSGRMRKIIDDDASTTHLFLAHQLPDLAGSFVAPIVVLVLIFTFDWKLGLACLVPLLSAFFILGFVMGKGNKFQQLYLNAQEEMSSQAVEYVRGIPVVKVFQQSIFSFKKFYDSIIRYKEMVLKYTLQWEKPWAFYTMIIHSFVFFIVPVGILFIGNSTNYEIIIANMFLYILITPIFADSIMKIMYISQGMYLAGEAVKRVENLTDIKPLEVSENAKKITNHTIEFKNVSFSYPDTKSKAVDDVSFSIPEGKTYALVGASGGGKTTIARLIPRFWDTTSGVVSIGETDVKEIAKDELMNKVSFVFQNTKLFKTTLLENIQYGNKNATSEAIERAIDLSQSREIIERLPNGLQTKIGTEGTYLSGGEQQRIVLARAILKDAPIVVLDEATAFADPENEHLIQKALQELMKGKTVLMIAHRLTSIQEVDKILVIEKGKIAEQGTHTDLLNQNGIYHKMWEEYQKSIKWSLGN